MIRALVLLTALAATPALAAPDRATAIATLAGFYNSADVCALQISRAKVNAYADAARAADDKLFNIDVVRATQALYAAQKDWSKEQTDAYCATAKHTAFMLGVTL